MSELGRELDDDSILGQQLIEDDSTVTVYIKDAAKQLELLKNANRLANTHVDYRLEIKVLKNTVDDLHKKYLGVLKQLEAASKELVHLHSLRRQARVGNTMETTGSACVTEPPQSQFTDKQGLKDTTGPHYTVVPARFTDKRGLNDNTAPSGIVMSPELSDKRGQQGTAGLDPAVASAQLTELTNKRGRKAVRKQQLKSEETNLGNRSLYSSRSATESNHVTAGASEISTPLETSIANSIASSPQPMTRGSVPNSVARGNSTLVVYADPTCTERDIRLWFQEFSINICAIRKNNIIRKNKALWFLEFTNRDMAEAALLKKTKEMNGQWKDANLRFAYESRYNTQRGTSKLCYEYLFLFAKSILHDKVVLLSRDEYWGENTIADSN
ncbi:hypothetical protein FPQ18DRAFT_310024 [Pyronema domesticum]|nr:hypothetical protein FPQ18DRAFT_310024 [Pyronema domesticum]